MILTIWIVTSRSDVLLESDDGQFFDDFFFFLVSSNIMMILSEASSGTKKNFGNPARGLKTKREGLPKQKRNLHKWKELAYLRFKYWTTR